MPIPEDRLYFWQRIYVTRYDALPNRVLHHNMYNFPFRDRCLAEESDQRHPERVRSDRHHLPTQV